MRGCPELSRLPKAQPRISSLHFRNQTPGSASNVFLQQLARNRDSRLDPAHPIGLLLGKQQQILKAATTSKFFTLRAMPMGVLLKPTSPNRRVEPFDTWDARVARGASTKTVAPMALHDPRPNRLSMSLQMASVSGFRTHQRVQIVRRFKTALSLIAIRNADVRQVDGRLRLVFDDEGKSNDWILQGWTYHVQPTLELYRMPYPELVSILRPMLRDLWTRGTKMEEHWTRTSLAKLESSATGVSRRASPPSLVAESRRASPPSQVPVSGLERLSSDGTTADSFDASQHLERSKPPNRGAASPPKRRTKSVSDPLPPLPSVSDSLPPVPAFDPFPSTPVPSVPTAQASPTSLPKKKPSQPVNWWAVGRVLEAAVSEGDYQGPTRWDPPPRASSEARSQESKDSTQPAPPPENRAPEPSRTSVQAKLAGMLFRPQSVIRPDSKERAAGQIPRRMNQFEHKDN